MSKENEWCYYSGMPSPNAYKETKKMSKEFIPYEEALALKELGFKMPCFSIYYSKDKSFSWQHHIDHLNNEPALESGEFNISAPLYQQAFKWFREKYKLFGEINLTTKQEDVEAFEFFCLDINEPLYESIDYNTYEEAELACLKKLIEIVNQNKEDE